MNWPKTSTEFNAQLAELEDTFSKLEPELEVTVRDPKTNMCGYAVVFNTMPDAGPGLSPCGKGGTRISPKVTLSEVRMLAKKMAMKNAAAGLPIGGSKSGLVADPDLENFEKTYRSFVSALKPVLRENGGIFGGFGFDIGARPIHPTWACDELGSTKSFTGKPLAMGGTDYDREGIAAFGVAVAAATALEYRKEEVRGKTFAVQGLGAMGASVVKYFSEYGGCLKAVSDPRIGGAYLFDSAASPLLIEKIISGDLGAAKTEIDKAVAANNCEFSANLNETLFADVDVVFPCAVQFVINESNVSKVKARYWVEGANSPVKASAYEGLYELGAQVIPDFIANPGGVIAAYVEMSSQLSAEENLATRGNVLRAKELTEELVSKNVTQIMDKSDLLSVTTREVARYVALRKICG